LQSRAFAIGVVIMVTFIRGRAAASSRYESRVSRLRNKSATPALNAPNSLNKT